MSKKKILQIYLEAGLDEIISEEPIKRLQPRLQKSDQTSLIVENKADVKLVYKQDYSREIFNIDSKINVYSAITKLAQRQNNLTQENSEDQSAPLLSVKQIIDQAKQMAEAAQNLQQLKQAVENFDGCSIKKMATNTVFSDGNPKSPIMVIGEAPGNQEDLQGIPFCGDSGKLLDEMFKAIGFKRENLYITNTLFWRPPGNRRPNEEELAMCQPFLQKHIFLVKPKLIVLMGATAMVDVLKINEPISKMRGKFFDYQNQYLPDPIKSTVLFHPAYLMRQSSKKREAWMDLLMIKKFLQENN